MMKIVLASSNKHKIKEVKDVLSDYQILSLKDIGFDREIIEDGNSFLDNALIKARTVMNYINDNKLDYLVLADDSGLCCKGLNLEPGIYSARYSGKSEKDNRKLLIKNLKDKDKSAYFNCTLVLMDKDYSYKSFEGFTYGKIIDEERGDTSFGYDSIFLSDDLGITFGEASENDKNRVSHRGRALNKLKDYLLLNDLVIKGVYKHFKGNYYIVEDVAYDSETMDLVVVYRALYDDNRLYVRKLSMFMSKVDKEKYPNVEQENRFTYIKRIGD